MKREDVLRINKSKPKNDFDEMEEQVTLKSMAISSLTLQVICLIFILLRLFCMDNKNILDLAIIMLSDFSVLELLIGKKLNSKVDIICGSISTILTILLFVIYIFIVLY